MKKGPTMPRARSALAALALSAAALVGCGPPPQAPTEAPAASFPEEGAQKVDISVSDTLPQWVLIARQADGGYIHWDRTSVVRYPGEEAEIWVQARFGSPQLYEAETETTRQAVRYEIERLHFRFKCAEETFAILERRFIGNEDRVLGTVPIDPVVYRPAPAGGVASLVQPIACRAQ